MGKSFEPYRKTIIRRTNEILIKDYEGYKEKDREVTFLMNCLLGILITTAEHEVSGNQALDGFDKVFNKKITEDEFYKLIPINVDFVKKGNDLQLAKKDFIVFHKKELIGKPESWFINKIRNGVAHQKIDFIDDGCDWTGVRIWDDKSGKRDFEIVFNINELLNFTLFLSSKYL